MIIINIYYIDGDYENYFCRKYFFALMIIINIYYIDGDYENYFCRKIIYHLNDNN